MWSGGRLPTFGPRSTHGYFVGHGKRLLPAPHSRPARHRNFQGSRNPICLQHFVCSSKGRYAEPTESGNPHQHWNRRSQTEQHRCVSAILHTDEYVWFVARGGREVHHFDSFCPKSARNSGGFSRRSGRWCREPPRRRSKWDRPIACAGLVPGHHLPEIPTNSASASQCLGCGRRRPARMSAA